MNHTPEPWAIDTGETYTVIHAGNKLIVSFREPGIVTAANAKRIVACVNSCKGVSNEWLQSHSVQARIDEIAELKQQRDQLLEALQDIAQMQPVTKANESSCFHLAKRKAIETINNITSPTQTP